MKKQERLIDLKQSRSLRASEASNGQISRNDLILARQKGELWWDPPPTKARSLVKKTIQERDSILGPFALRFRK